MKARFPYGWLMGLWAGGLISGCLSPPRPGDGRVHISYWEKWTGFEGEAMRAVVEEFNWRQDRIFVDLLTISRVDQKMLLATAGGVPPDVAGLWSFNVNVYADKNAILPLDEYCRRAGIGPEDYIPAYWDLGVYKGHVWALPTTPASIALHWNKDLFRKAGLDPERPPRTIEELDEYAAKLTKYDEKGNLVQIGFMPSEPGWWNWAWGYFFGGKLYDEETQRITCASPENIRAFEWVQSYAKKYGVSALQTFQSGFGNFSSPQNAFLAGKVAMELQGVWMHNFIDKYAPHLDWGAAPFPHPADRPDLYGVTNVEEDILVIPRGAKHPDEAFEFIKFVNSQEGMELLCMGQRKHTPLSRVSREFLESHPNPYIEVFISLAKSPNAFSTPKIGIWTEYRDELAAAFDDIWLLRKTPEEALRQVQERMQRKLERELRRQRRWRREIAWLRELCPLSVPMLP
ncbi:MAG TPA: ABC transporter substrate-binding protein [Armatimonadetes bacterium]|nr:ABC transporter substrate-binding protein [Armatimonadota bacterium]